MVSSWSRLGLMTRMGSRPGRSGCQLLARHETSLIRMGGGSAQGLSERALNKMPLGQGRGPGEPTVGVLWRYGERVVETSGFTSQLPGLAGNRPSPLLGASMRQRPELRASLECPAVPSAAPSSHGAHLPASKISFYSDFTDTVRSTNVLGASAAGPPLCMLPLLPPVTHHILLMASI